MNLLDALKVVDESSVDMILTDLPYGTTQCSWDEIIPFEEMWEVFNKIIKPNGAIVLFGAEPFSSRLRMSNIDNFKYDWVWDKIKGTGFLNAKKQPLRGHEMIHVFYKSQTTYNPQMTYGHPRKKSFRSSKHQTDVYGEMNNDYKYDSTERYPRSVQTFSSDTQNSSIHPTQKPVSLCEYLIRTYTNEGDTVFDGTMGSGTTGVACLNENRRFIGIELDKGMFDKATTRLNMHKQNTQMKLF